MKLNNLHQRSPLEISLGKNSAVTQLYKKRYWHNWKDLRTNRLSQKEPAHAGGQGGHYDSYIAGKPRFQKYFGGSFIGSI